MTIVQSQPFQPDGFVIVNLADETLIDFIACTKDEPSRERVERGLAMKVDLDRFYFFDTRWT